VVVDVEQHEGGCWGRIRVGKGIGAGGSMMGWPLRRAAEGGKGQRKVELLIGTVRLIPCKRDELGENHHTFHYRVQGVNIHATTSRSYILGMEG
jgi:hypothetical protein